MQLAPASIAPPQVFVVANGPNAFIDAIESATPPVFLSSTASEELVVLISCAGNRSGELGENLSSPVFSMVVIVALAKLSSTTSSLLSPFRSPAAEGLPLPEG